VCVYGWEKVSEEKRGRIESERGSGGERGEGRRERV